MINVEILDLARQRSVEEWPVWSKEPSSFDWDYTEKEQFLILSGVARLTSPCGIDKTIRSGDFVTVEKGILVHWDITEEISKHYKFFK